MGFKTYENDSQALEGYLSDALPGGKIGNRTVTIYGRGALSLSDFLNSQTIKTPCIMVAYMGFAKGEGKESGRVPRTKSYSVFVHLGQPGAAQGKRADPLDAEAVADAIMGVMEGEKGLYLLANNERRRVAVEGGSSLYLSHGYDVFELSVTIE